jgi:hypothetical protein
MVMAVTLAAVGVSDDDIADDYALSQLVLDRLLAEWFEYMGVTDETEKRRLWGLADPRREAMLDTLSYLRQRHGGATQYLLDAGVTREQLDRLRTRLVEVPRQTGA